MVDQSNKIVKIKIIGDYNMEKQYLHKFIEKHQMEIFEWFHAGLSKKTIAEKLRDAYQVSVTEEDLLIFEARARKEKENSHKS
jgi:hypothetical protein